MLMKEWSSSSNREFMADASTAGQPSYGNSVLNHSASCVVLPKHPTAQQLLYLKQRQLIKFAHPEDYVSALDSDSNISAAALLKALEQTSATSKKSLASVLEIDRDKSIIRRICRTRWNPSAANYVVKGIRGFALAPRQMTRIVRKVLDQLSETELNDLPPLVNQLLLLASKGEQALVLSGLADHFDALDLKGKKEKNYVCNQRIIRLK